MRCFLIFHKKESEFQHRRYARSMHRFTKPVGIKEILMPVSRFDCFKKVKDCEEKTINWLQTNFPITLINRMKQVSPGCVSMSLQIFECTDFLLDT